MNTDNKEKNIKTDPVQQNAGKAGAAPDGRKPGGHGYNKNRRNRSRGARPAEAQSTSKQTSQAAPQSQPKQVQGRNSQKVQTQEKPLPAAKGQDVRDSVSKQTSAPNQGQDQGRKKGHGDRRHKGGRQQAAQSQDQKNSSPQSANASETPQSPKPAQKRIKQDRQTEKKPAPLIPQTEPVNSQTYTDTDLFSGGASGDGYGFDSDPFALAAEEERIIDSMPPDPTLDSVFADVAEIRSETPSEGTEVVGIHFPQGGKVYWFDPAGISFEKDDFVIVETARGSEMGSVALSNRKVPDTSIVQPLRPVVRKATDADLEHEEDNRRKAAAAIPVCRSKVEKHNLEMKLVGAQYTFDNAKLIFYFTAASRVDFRELVKDLASEFRTRIELRQIGIRDEAKMLGGYGVCGRKLCCSYFLPNFAQVSVKMAKEQGLSLNSSKISGSCGRLMCCLRFEQSTYEKELSSMPAPDSIVDTPDGRGTVTEVRPVGYTLKVKLDDKPDQLPRTYRLCDIKVIKKAEYKSFGQDETDSELPEE